MNVDNFLIPGNIEQLLAPRIRPEPISLEHLKMALENINSKIEFTPLNFEPIIPKFKLIKVKHSLAYRILFPVQCDNISNFSKSLFFPSTLTKTPSITSRVSKVAMGILKVLFDLMTLPVRLMTAIPYVIYARCIKKKNDFEFVLE